MNGDARDGRTAGRDRGNVLPLTLILLTVGSLIVVALLTFASTLFLNRPPLEERSDSLEAVRSGMRMAITMQRDHGPEGCYDQTTGGFNVNNRFVGITCTVLTSVDDSGGRFGLIATTNQGDGGGEAIAGTGTQKRVIGSVFANGGSLGGDAATIKLVAGDLHGSTYSSASTDGYRYKAIDPATDLPVAPAMTCQTMFGAQVLQVDFAPFGIAPPITADPNGPTGVRVTPDPGTDVLGVVVTDNTGVTVLDRSPDGSGVFLVDPPTALAVLTNVRVCYQSVPDTDPTWVPDDVTFCDSPLVDPEVFDQIGAPDAPDGIQCGIAPWWNYAGWKPNPLADYIYPMLPQVPTYIRSSTPVQVGTSNCYVFYPGRYQSSLDLDSDRNYYFASGVYLFEDELKIHDEARVVGGEGTWSGCTFDADAAFLSGSPRYHEITGKGVTFLLADDGHIDIDNASLRLNQRVATNSTRASAGINVMSVNLATPVAANSPVEIPVNDRVLLPGCLASEVATNPSCAEDVTTYSITPVTGGTPVSYPTSNLGHDDAIIDAQLDGTLRWKNRVQMGGAIFVPNARVEVSRTQADDVYDVELRGGVTASTFDFDFPVGGDSRFTVGEVAPVVYEKVQLQALTTFNGKDFTSVVELEVDNVDRYAINNWIVGTGGGPPPPPPPPPVCTGGDPHWTVDFYNGTSLSGAIESTLTINSLFFDEHWGWTAPPGTTVGDNGFSARFTRTVDLPSAGTYEFTVGSDDGQRFYVDGALVIDDWNAQTYGAGTNVVQVVVADPCDVDLMLEYFEQTGDSRASVSWVLLP